MLFYFLLVPYSVNVLKFGRPRAWVGFHVLVEEGIADFILIFLD